MSHKITKHHLTKKERVPTGNPTHREKKDNQRLMYTSSIKERQEKFDQNRDAFLGSKAQNKFTQKVKAEEAAIAGSKSPRVKR